MLLLARVVAVAAAVMVVVALAQLPFQTVSAQSTTFAAAWTVAVPASSVGGTATVTFTSAVSGCDSVTDTATLTAGEIETVTTSGLEVEGGSRNACVYSALLAVPSAYQTPAEVDNITSSAASFSFGTLALAVVASSTTTTAAVSATSIDVATVVHDNVVETAPEIISVIAAIFPFVLAMGSVAVLIGMATRSFIGVIHSAGRFR